MNRIRALLAPVRRSRLAQATVAALAALAIPAAVLGGAAPASAVTNLNHLCETFGSYCVGFDTPTNDAYVIEQNPGRDVTLIDLTSSTIKIQTHADTSLCVAGANNATDVKLHGCDGALGTIWIKHRIDSTHFSLESQRFPGLYLAGPNTGSRFQLLPPGVAGWFYNFHLV